MTLAQSPVSQWQENEQSSALQQQHHSKHPRAHHPRQTAAPTAPYQHAALENITDPPRPSGVSRSQYRQEDLSISSYDEAYGSLAEQDRGYGNARLGPVGSIDQNQFRASPNEDYVPAEQSVPASQTPAIQSPFFRKGQTYARPDTLQTLTDDSRGHSRPSKQPLFQPQAQDPPLHVTQQRTAPFEPVYPSHLRNIDYNPPPLTTSGPICRPDRLSASSFSQLQSRQSAQTPRARVSLPPNSARAPERLRGNQDGALSRIQGVRGLASKQSQPSMFAAGPAYGVSRELYSAAGSRRSVRG